MRDRALGSTIRMQFNSTNPDGGGAPVAPSTAFAVADIRIYKDGSATEKATTNGLTVTSPFDSITGLHLVEIDTSNATGDSGFWASGSVYHVRLVTAKTVATYSVSGLLIGEFSIELQTADVRKIGGDGQSATDLKDFADAGYDPATNKLTGAVGLDSADKATLVDLIWDEPLTGATHNVATSSGKRLRQTTAFQQIDATVNDAAASTTTFITTLSSSVDDFYNDSMLVFTDGALAGQVRAIYDYIGATKTIILEEALTSAPVNGVAFAIVSLHIHPVSQRQSGLATAAALATESTKITAIETFATRVTTGLVADGAVYQFTANMLELAPSSGGGAGDASQATLLEVKAKTDLIGTTSGISSLLAASVLTPGTITEFPDTLTIGDSYTTANGRSIQIPIVDTDGNQISSTGSLNFADATATFVIKRAKETDSTRIITGTAAFTDPVGTGTSGAPYAVVQLTSSETAKGLIGYKYSGVLTFTWPYVGTGTDPEVMSFETDTLLFDN